MHDQPAEPDSTDPVAAAGDRRALWDRTVAALAAAGIDVVQAGDGRPGAVLELGPRGLAVAVRWQLTDQHPLPSGVLAVSVCRTPGGDPPSARFVQNLVLESHLAGAGLGTAYADEHLVVLDPDVVLPGASGRRP
ncbi:MULTISPECIES: hypothetical protein [unclassified Kitasatospora]|uniref:hypothetical protein n=1 Tax=unclassified Kitasatospora TaxID=2633591 RepID=UPI00382E270E